MSTYTKCSNPNWHPIIRSSIDSKLFGKLTLRLVHLDRLGDHQSSSTVRFLIPKQEHDACHVTPADIFVSGKKHMLSLHQTIRTICWLSTTFPGCMYSISSVFLCGGTKICSNESGSTHMSAAHTSHTSGQHTQAHSDTQLQTGSLFRRPETLSCRCHRSDMHRSDTHHELWYRAAGITFIMKTPATFRRVKYLRFSAFFVYLFNMQFLAPRRGQTCKECLQKLSSQQVLCFQSTCPQTSLHCLGCHSDLLWITEFDLFHPTAFWCLLCYW